MTPTPPTSTTDPAPTFTFSTLEPPSWAVAGHPVLSLPSNTSYALLVIHGPDGGEIARAERNGTVKVSREGAESEAARRFWGAIESMGTGLIAHMRALEERLARHEVVERFPL